MKERLRRTTTNRLGKVLAVNSDPEIAYILEVNFTHANFEVVTARNGREALNKIHREKPDIIVLDTALSDIDGIELCRKLKESEDTRHIPVILISAKTEGSNKMVKAMSSADNYITKPFNPKDVVDMVRTYLKDEKRTENVSPLTGLPNQVQVNNEITGIIEQKKTFAAMYISMDDIRSFNKVYGYDQGDHTIRLLADIITEAVRLFGNPDDLAGHLGGDKFVVISTPWKVRSICRRVIADFNRRIKSLYADQHLQRGYTVYESPADSNVQSPVMSLRVAVVTNQRREFYHYLEVSEAAAEQMEHMKRYPNEKSYFDLQASGFEPDQAVSNRVLPNANREEVRAMQGVLVWLDFMIKELDIPVTSLKECLTSIEQLQEGSLNYEQQNNLEIIRENIGKMNRVVEGLVHLTKAEWLVSGAVLEEVRIGDTLDWVTEQLRELAEPNDIETCIEGADDTGRLLIDRKKLTQGLLYVLRGEIQSSMPGDRIKILVADMDEEFINIRITNPNRYVQQQTLVMLLRGQQEGVRNEVLRNQLYPAKLLIESLGGELSVVSDESTGTTYTVIVPKKWQSLTQESNALQLAVDISRKEARAELSNLRGHISSLVKQMPEAIGESLETLRGKVLELGVLCNRSLFLADELNGRLESQQDRLLRQEAEQIAALEAIIAICREIAGSMEMENIFILDSARETAKYAMEIAREMRLSESDCQILYHAALLKDLGLALSPADMVEQKVVKSIEQATTIKTLFNNIWKALSAIPFLSPALVFILYRYERYNGKSGELGIRGDNIPLGSRILAIADTFEAMTSGRFPYEELSPKAAVQKIVDESGTRFAPHVVKAFLTKWKKRELKLTSKEM